MSSNKKREEKLVTDFFLAKLNEAFGTSYRTQVIESELTRVDTRGVSDADNQQPLDFQVTYADNGLPHEGGAVLGRKFRPHASNIVDLTTPYDVAAAIARKQDRYGRADAAKLILIVWKTRSCLIEPQGLDWNEKSIWFKGCYFVCLPGGGAPGQVLTLKPAQLHDGRLLEL